MKKLFVILFVLISNLFAQTTPMLLDLIMEREFGFIESCYKRIEDMKERNYFSIHKENESEPYVMLNNLYFYDLRSTNDRYLEIPLLIIAHYISDNRDKKSPLKSIVFKKKGDKFHARYRPVEDDIIYTEDEGISEKDKKEILEYFENMKRYVESMVQEGTIEIDLESPQINVLSTSWNNYLDGTKKQIVKFTALYVMYRYDLKKKTVPTNLYFYGDKDIIAYYSYDDDDIFIRE